jgi:hypothetical protein
VDLAHIKEKKSDKFFMWVGAEIARCQAKRKILLFDAMRHEPAGLWPKRKLDIKKPEMRHELTSLWAS